MKKLSIPDPETYSKAGARAVIEHKLKQDAAEGKPAEAEKIAPKPSGKEFHLSPEQVRTNALQAAIAMHGEQLTDPKTMIDMAAKYEAYIQNGI